MTRPGAKTPETVPTMRQILADVQNGSLALPDAIRLANAHIRAAEIRGERKRKGKAR